METALVSVICIAVLIVGMVTVTFNAFEAATTVADSLKEMEQHASEIRLTEIAASEWGSDAVCAIAYQGGGDDGFLKTVDITSSGQIADTILDTLEFDAVDGYEPSAIHISDSIHAVAYRGTDADGFLKTIEVATNGQITDAVLDTLEFDAADGYEPSIICISGDVYAIAYRGTDDDGLLTTVEIASNGQITDAVLDTLEFDAADGYEPDMVLVSGDVYAIAYRGTDDDGLLTTVEIASNGQITDAVLDTLEFDAVDGYEPSIVHVSGDVYAIAYRGTDAHGFVKTVGIATDGQITDAVLDTLEFDAASGYEPSMVRASGDACAIAYRGAGDGGFLATVEIASDGQITDTVIDTLEFNAGNSYEPNIVAVSDSVYAIAYRGGVDYGYLSTVEIAAGGRITDTVIDTLEFDTTMGYEPNIIHVRNGISLAVTNEGQTNLAQFAKWDVIAEYRKGGTSHQTYLEYTAEGPPGDNQWTMAGIYLAGGDPEVYDPGILNPGEKMKLIIDLQPSIGSGTTARITLSTPNGVRSQCLVRME